MDEQLPAPRPRAPARRTDVRFAVDYLGLSVEQRERVLRDLSEQGKLGLALAKFMVETDLSAAGAARKRILRSDGSVLHERQIRRAIERARIELGRLPKSCLHCGRPLRLGRRADARYHPARQEAAYRARRKQRCDM